MLQELHYPSKWTVAIVFFVLILLIVGVFVWAFYLNLGTLVVTSDDPFTLMVGDEEQVCDQGRCELTLSPGTYDFVAQRDGYYDITFSYAIHRFQSYEESLTFVLIPFLQEVDTLPSAALVPYYLRSSGSDQILFSRESSEELTRFESLLTPELRWGEGVVIVLDQGRMFVVDVETGRKNLRFDDTVFVRDVLVSDSGKRMLLFVTHEDTDQVWLWYQDSSELSPLTWSLSSGFVEWKSGSDHLLYVIGRFTGQGASLFEDLLVDANIQEAPLTLSLLNLDVDDLQTIQSFNEKIPTALISRSGRYFVEYEGGGLDELVVR